MMLNIQKRVLLEKKLFARMVYAWPRFKRTLAAIKPLLDSGRIQDTVALPLAGAWVALHDEELTDAQDWIDTFDLEQDIQRMRESSDNDEFLTHLMSSKLNVGKEGALSVAEVCLRTKLEKVRPLLRSAEDGRHAHPARRFIWLL